MRKRVESGNSPQPFDVLLAAVYVPKNLSATSPFFSVVAYRQPASECKKNLEGMIADHAHDKRRPEGGVMEFSASGRDYFRVNLARGEGGRHECIICTLANRHLLIWQAGAQDEKGLEAIVESLDSITPLPQQSAPETRPSLEPKDGATEGIRSALGTPDTKMVKVSSGVTSGLLIKKVPPTYPQMARQDHIQGTVLLRAEISKTGDITDLELLDGPIELAGSAVTAVRQWKCKPYLLMGQPVAVRTQIQVNYQLSY